MINDYIERRAKVKSRNALETGVGSLWKIKKKLRGHMTASLCVIPGQISDSSDQKHIK